MAANALTSGVPTSVSGNTGNSNKRSVSSEKKHSKQTIEKLNNMIVASGNDFESMKNEKG